MNAQHVAERSAVYALEDAVAPVPGEAFDLLATAPQGVAKLRELILSLAVCGKLVAQRQSDEPASVLVQQFNQEKARLSKTGALKRAKPSSSIGDDELAHELPAGWRRIRLGDLVSKIGAGSTPLGGRQVYTSSGVKFLRSQNVWNSGLVLDGVVHIPQSVHEHMAATKVVGGDLLFNITGASIGRCSLVPDNFDEANVSQHVTIVRPALASMRQFLHLVLTSPFIQKTVMDRQVGVSREGLSIGKLSRFVIPLPPLAEQRRIVARVEELMGLCDELETHGRLQDEQHARLVATLFDALVASASPAELSDNWQRIARHFDLLLDRPAAVDALEQTVLQLAVRGLLVPQDPREESARSLIAHGASKSAATGADQLPALPRAWEWTTIGAIASVGTGTTPSRTNPAYFSPASVRWVTSGETSQRFIESTQQGVSPLALRDTSLKVYPSGTLIVAMYGQGKTRGQVSELRIDATTNQACAAIVPTCTDVAHRRYLKLFFEKIYDEIRGLSAGGAQPNLNVGKVKGTLVPLPPLAEQHRIVARVDALRALCANLRQNLQQAQATQADLADALVSNVAHDRASVST